MNQKKIAILGATGLVGREMLKTLEERDYPIKDIKLLASPRSAGTVMTFKGEKYVVEAVNENSFKDIDIALFSAGGGTSRTWAPVAVESGCVVVDNSSAWRMDPSCPLVIPEINGDDIKEHKGIIANPNCSTIQALMAIWPLHKYGNLKYMNISTYQSVAGTGIKAVDELKEESSQVLANEKVTTNNVYPHQIAFNLLPHIGSFDDDGISEEEWKMVNESKKIMHLPELRVSGITVRVPIFRCHGESVTVQFEREISPTKAREILSEADGVALQDDVSQNIYPLPVEVQGKDEVYVGRVRKDTGLDNAIAMWVVGDNLRKGAALNAVQIAEHLLTM